MKLLHELVSEAARSHPEREAVRGVDAAISYAQLDALADAVALRLQAAGVQQGDRVGLWLDKSVLTVACMQACLRLGAVYIPLDPLSPSTRVNTIAQDADTRVVVTDPERAPSLALACLIVEPGESSWRALLDGGGRLDARAAGEPTDLAYILYTSGSTGTPKGVCISHRNALAFVEWAVRELALCADDRLSSHAPFHFDLSVLDLYGAFSVGACVSLLAELSAKSPMQLLEYARREQISVWYSVPSALIMMMQGASLLSVDDWAPRVVCFAGESFPISQLRTLRRHWPHARMLNLYGPTETNVCTFYELGELQDDRSIPVPIGVACSGDEVWVETESGARAGVGETGELICDGPTVMLGYWGKPAQQGPYRTGDIVRVEPDQNLYFIGRRDHMVKVRGHRIELGEIEAALAAHAKIAEVAVIVGGEGLEAKLVAYVVAAGEQRPSLVETKRHCAERLPQYMIIDRLRLCEALPRTRNGKVARRELAQRYASEAG